MKNILTLNNISQKGLGVFCGTNCLIGKSFGQPVDAIIVRSAEVDTTQYPNLIAVARAGAGVNNISVTDATNAGVCVFNTPGANANAVAELVFTMLGTCARSIENALIFSKGLMGSDQEINEKVEAGKKNFVGFELAGKTLGVIGLGKIGVLVANGGIVRDMKVIGYDPSPSTTNMHSLDQRVIVTERLGEVMTRADIISVHVPLSGATKNMIGLDQIKMMKKGCILLNYARSGIYDEKAVVEGINSGVVKIYITDFPNSFLVDSCSNKLISTDSVVFTPHLGASTEEAEEKCAVMACNQLKNFLYFGTVLNSVNFPTLDMKISPTIKTRLSIVNRDVPNMIASITGVIGEAGLNIHQFVNSGNGIIGYNLVDLEVEVQEMLLERIRKINNVLRVRAIRFD